MAMEGATVVIGEINAGNGKRVAGECIELGGHGAFVHTDVWTSMGQEAETLRRQAAFEGYCVNRELMKGAHPGAIVLHCLPAHRGEEIGAEYLDGPEAVVWTEAENRLHAQKALLEHLLR